MNRQQHRRHQGLGGFSGLMEELMSNAPKMFTENIFSNECNKELQNVPVNINEKEDGYYLEVVAPGLSKEAIVLQIEDNVLVISHESVESSSDEEKSEKGNALKSEYSYKSFKRSFKLGNKVDIDKISAKYENGILYVAIPKKEVVLAGNKTISIN